MPLSLDGGEHLLAQAGVGHQLAVAGCQSQIALGQHHVHVGQQRAEERPLPVHALQQGQLGLGVFALGIHKGFDGRTKAKPPRQRKTALPPAEAPRNGTQVLDLLAGLARCGARSNIQLGDLADGRGVEEVLGKARGLVHQRAVAGHAGQRELRSSIQKRLGGRLGGLQQGGFERGGHQGFEVAAADFGVGVFRRDDFALLRQANLPAHRTRRLRQDGLVAGTTAPAHRAAPAVEHAQLDAVAGGKFVEEFDEGNLGAVQLPVAGEDAAVLVAVAVAQHDVLLATTALHQCRHAGQRIELAHDGRGVAQVFNGFKQRHHDEVVLRFGIERAVHQAHFLLQQQHFEQIAHRFGVADDVVANGLVAKPLTHHPGGFKNGQLALGVGRILGAHHAQRARVVQQLDQQRALGGLLQARVVRLDARLGQQFGHHLFVLVRALAQVHRGQVEAKHLHGADQRVQTLLRQRFAMV